MAIIKNVISQTISGHQYYFGTLPSSLLREVTFVPVVEASKGKEKFVNEEVSKEKNYQRPGSAQRMRKLKEHLKEHSGAIVPPILLSTRDRWAFKPTSPGSTLGEITITGPAAIIDGQHRAGGFVALFEDTGDSRPVAFYAVANLDQTTERKQFHTINTTQKNVVASLGVFITRFEDEYAQLAWEVDQSESSPFRGRISTVQRGPGHLFTLAALKKNLERTFSNGCFAETRPERRLDIFEEYWNAIFDAYPDATTEEIARIDAGESMQFKLLEATGLILWSHLASQVLPRCFNPQTDEIDAELMRTLVASAGKIDWRKDGTNQGKTGEAGANWIRKEMEHNLAKLAPRAGA